jgi:site-specific recombinase XerD
MASIRERTTKGGETTWAVLYRINGKQSSTAFTNPASAEKFRTLVDILGPAKALATLDSERADGPTVDQLAAKFFAWKASDVTPRTLTDYRRDYDNWIKPRLGARHCSSLDERDIQDFVDDIAKHLEPKSVADRHMLLHSMFKFGAAKTRRIVDYNPCLETTLPKRGKRLAKGATLPEWQALKAAARAIEPDAADLMEFIAGTGWRWSEAAALPVRNVAEWDEDGRTVMRATVAQVFRRGGDYRQTLAQDEAKSQAGLRTVKVPDSVAAIVRRRIVGKGPDDLVFTNRSGRKWYQQNFLSRTWPRIEARAGLDRHLTPHAIRHLHVALLDRSGATPAEMKRRLGHEDIQTTLNVYGGMIDDIDAGVLDKLDALLTSDAPVAGEVIASDVVRELT